MHLSLLQYGIAGTCFLCSPCPHFTEMHKAIKHRREMKEKVVAVGNAVP